MFRTSMIASFALSLLAAACHEPAAESVFEPNAPQYGKSHGEWAAAWWQWALAIPAAENPITDGDCGAGQSGDVFFLAGNFGGESTRACTVPAGKALFFPVMNVICYPSPEVPEEGCGTPKTEAELTTCAEGYFGGVPAMTVTVDGEALDDVAAMRAASAMFSWHAPADPADHLWEGIGPIEANTCGIAEGDRFGVTDGYWIMLRPLEPGEHTVHFSGASDSFALDVTYTITQQ